MQAMQLAAQAEGFLQHLCNDIPGRNVGSAGNRAATSFVAERFRQADFEVETPEFDCIDWQSQGVKLNAGAESFDAQASPFSNGCDLRATLHHAGTRAELQALQAHNGILLLHGELTREQLMPRNFEFYNPEEHRQLYQLLEKLAPAAIIAATSRDPQMAGAIYPFPLFEDGDFAIPSVYLTDEQGQRLLAYAGTAVELQIVAQRQPARGWNVIGRRGDPMQRVVFCAHIDAKAGTPGAIDNASGSVVLLLLAELLRDYRGKPGVELLLFNGEDYYSAPGEQLYLAQNAGYFHEIVLAVNMDGLGYRQGHIAYSLYECPQELQTPIRAVFHARPGFVEGPPWYQGDHMLFLMQQRPVLALTSELAAELMASVVHSTNDTIELVDPQRLVATAEALASLVAHLGA